MPADPKPARRVKARARDWDAARAWKQTVLEMRGGLSWLSDEPATDPHHIVTRARLRQLAPQLGVGAEWLLFDARNGMPLTRDEHANHHSRKRPILMGDLPERVFSFVADYGLQDWLARYYPAGVERAA